MDREKTMRYLPFHFFLLAPFVLTDATAAVPNPPQLTVEGGVTVQPPQNNQGSHYRGIPDPSSIFGFNVWEDYPATEIITGSHATETLTCNGTATQPCLIDTSAATFEHLTVSGSFFILQGGRINAAETDGAHLRVDCNSCVIRDVEVAGPGVDTGHSSAVSMSSFSAWIRGSIHGFGDNSVSAREQDFHGMKVMSDDVWIIDAEIYDNSGDSIQVGDASRGSASRVYIGGGFFHHNRENGVDIKDSHDVVVSGVRMEGFRPTSSSPGEALVIHDDAYDARIYDNIIRDSSLGIVSSGLSGHVISGNDIVGLSVGIQLRNTQDITVIDNIVSAPTPIEVQGGMSGTIQDY